MARFKTLKINLFLLRKNHPENAMEKLKMLIKIRHTMSLSVSEFLEYRVNVLCTFATGSNMMPFGRAKTEYILKPKLHV